MVSGWIASGKKFGKWKLSKDENKQIRFEGVCLNR